MAGESIIKYVRGSHFAFATYLLSCQSEEERRARKVELLGKRMKAIQSGEGAGLGLGLRLEIRMVSRGVGVRVKEC